MGGLTAGLVPPSPLSAVTASFIGPRSPTSWFPPCPGPVLGRGVAAGVLTEARHHLGCEEAHGGVRFGIGHAAVLDDGEHVEVAAEDAALLVDLREDLGRCPEGVHAGVHAGHLV